MNSTGQRIGP